MNLRLNFSLLFLVLATLLAMPITSSAGIILSIGIAPRPLPVYGQPLSPGDGYIWTPGYWAYDDNDGYFWVPASWVEAPEPGFLWTPGYWGWVDSVYVFHEGYWGPQVGFYGGIDYGFGYAGVGYAGGYWNKGAFFYNRSVNNVGNATNVYNKIVVVNNINVNRVSYNGGEGGLTARATQEEEGAAHNRHVPPTIAQTSHVQAASTNRQLFDSQNHGKPAIAATAKPAEFSGRNVVAAKAAAPSYKPATASSASRTLENQTAAHPNTPVHVSKISPIRPAAPNTGKPQLDQNFQRQQDSLNAKEDQERLKQQKTQEQDHQRLALRKVDEPTKQQLEQKHQQQTQQIAAETHGRAAKAAREATASEPH
jgi:hypothetical protein